MQVKWYQRLTARVLLFLTLALVPLGAIGVVQNTSLLDAFERQTQLSFLATTARAASRERQILQRSVGSAETAAALLSASAGDPQACDVLAAQLVQSARDITVAKYYDIDGALLCTSATGSRTTQNASELDGVRFDPRRPTVTATAQRAADARPTATLMQPAYQDDTLIGFMGISIPLGDLTISANSPDVGDLVFLATFNASGEIISTRQDSAVVARNLPASMPITDLVQGDPRTFLTDSESGSSLAYAVVPLVPDLAYAIGAWSIEATATSQMNAPKINAVLPLLMWLASLLVAWFVIDRLVISRIGGLHRAMVEFGDTRTVSRTIKANPLTSELSALETSFQSMARDLLLEDAQKEAQLREKSILLKEVHHRVKNNLQIISSILNMQIRKAQMGETRLALSQVQDRIMALSGVHRTLYEADNLTKIDAADLIGQIAHQTSALAQKTKSKFDVEMDLNPVLIFPDQAVPLSMLVAEMLTNAIKYIDPNEKGESCLNVQLGMADERLAKLSVTNTRRVAGVEETDTSNGAGLGTQLIRAFATQLRASIETVSDDNQHTVSVVFEVEEFKEATPDF